MSSKQKIIIIGPAYPLRGGIANFNEALCRQLLKDGYDAKIISFSLQYPSFLFPGKTQLDTGKGPDDLKIETKINSIDPFNWAKVAHQIVNEKPIFVIIRYWLPFMAFCLGTIAKKLKKHSIKIIAITDNVIPHEKRIGDIFLTRFFVKQCNGFVTMAKAVYDDLSRFTQSDKKIILPHPVYDIFGDKVGKLKAKNELRLNQEDKYLLFFGFIRSYKGLDLLLKAMADERIKKAGIKLIVAGEFYEAEDAYQAIIHENQLQQAVLLHTSFIPAEQVKFYFCAADMIVQPYRTATQSGVTQIAYHFERPMLVTNVGGLPEIVPDNKVGYVTAPSPVKIADAIVDFYTNSKEQQFVAAIVTEKQRFQWSFFVKGVIDLYQQL